MSNSNTPINNIPNGRQYLESLNDGREVWYDGEKVKNLVEHPAFRNAARTVAQLYDSMHDPAYQEQLTCVDKKA